MNSLIRVTSMVNRVCPANPHKCLESILSLFEREEVCTSDVIILPQLALCSPSCGSLFQNRSLLDRCRQELDNLSLATRNYNAYILVGLAVRDCSRPLSVCAVLHQGRVLGLIPSLSAEEFSSHSVCSDKILPPDTVFSAGDLTFSVLSGDPKRLPFLAQQAEHTGCDLLVVPSYQPLKAGELSVIRQSARLTSRLMGCAIALCNGGIGDTSSPYLFQGYAGIYECGEELAFQRAGYEEIQVTCDLDTDIISSQKTFHTFQKPLHSIQIEDIKKRMLRSISKDPFLSSDPQEAQDYLEELFSFQVRSLVNRLENTGIHKVVIGVSGGLDSTLALLTAAAALDILEYPRQNLIGVTMPGFGTSDRTYFNALSLLEGLNATSRDISIKAAVLQHFEDIGHDPALKDVTYENAQARERTQILLDIGNGEGALVVGTGDLSEGALGWSTFAGDQMAGYNVNICITKTMVQKIVAYIAKEQVLGGVSEILLDILDTPVSPELLPPDRSGAIQQKTEEILGPYQLHDFFLYYFVKYGFRPGKLYYYACTAFADQLSPSFIKEKLGIFIRRFFSGQFKRSCSPDCAALTEVNLTNAEHYIPSDCSPSELLRELEDIRF